MGIGQKYLSVIAKVSHNREKVHLHCMANFYHNFQFHRVLKHQHQIGKKNLSIAGYINKPLNGKRHLFAWGNRFPKYGPLMLYEC